MPKYKVEGTISGYSRGQIAYLIEADNEEQAKELWYEGEELYDSIVRDDREAEPDTVTLIEE